MFINSATAGLFLSTELLGLGPGDDVVLPSVSFVAAGNAVAATGARPVFCDVDERTLNPTAADIERALTPRTKAVLVLHYGGYPGDIAAIAALCQERGIPLIEGAACAVASTADGTACGAFGDVAMWSFDSMKVLVTGDGGMLYVRDQDSHIGPNTSIGRDCTLRGTQVSESIVMDGATISQVPGLQGSVIGRNATVGTTPEQDPHHRLVVGDHTRIEVAA